MIVGTWTSKPAKTFARIDYYNVDLPTAILVAHGLLIFQIGLVHKGVITEGKQIPSYSSQFLNRKTATLSYLQQSSCSIPLKKEKIIHSETQDSLQLVFYSLVH